MKAKHSVSEEEIKEAILKYPGPFVTPKRIYRQLSSRTRPEGEEVGKQMTRLQEVNLGTLFRVDRSYYFYKARLPSEEIGDTLATFNVSVAEYTENFNKIDSGLTDLQRDSATRSHPNGEQYDEYIVSASQNSQTPK